MSDAPLLRWAAVVKRLLPLYGQDCNTLDDLEAFLRGAAAVEQGAPAAPCELREALEKLLAYAESRECLHESTHRGGAIWTICDDCGRKWSDDRNPFKPYCEPPPITQARAALAVPAVPSLTEGRIVDVWNEEMRQEPFDVYRLARRLAAQVHPAEAINEGLTDEQIAAICEKAWEDAECETDNRIESPETEWLRYGEKIARAILAAGRGKS